MSDKNVMYSALHWAAKSEKYAAQAQAGAQAAQASQETAQNCEENCREILTSLGSPALRDLSNVESVSAGSAAASKEDVTALQKQTDTALAGKAAKDLSDVNSPAAAFKRGAVEWIGPDYTRPVTLASGVSYTADRCGWLLVAVSAVGIYSTCNLLINGVQVMDFYATAASAAGRYATLLPVSKGDTYVGTGLSTMIFLPCKGEI